MRLFSALLLPSEVSTSLLRELDSRGGMREEPGLRWMPVSQWHVTLGFYGLDDLSTRTRWLRDRLAGSRVPKLRVEGSGTFRGVFWCRVQGVGLDELAEATRPEEDKREFLAHLTLARGQRQQALERWRRLLTDYQGPQWQATEVVLMRSDRDERGARYTVVERFPLGSHG